MIAMKSLTYLKRSCLLLCILWVMYLLFIYGLTLHKTDNRPVTSYSLTEADAKELLPHLDSTSDEIEIIKRCNKFACKKLSFHRKNNLKIGEANCIGYAQYTSAILNYAFKYKNILCTAQPVVGQVHLYGINIHPLVVAIIPKNLKSFFKDHDFVEIRKKNGDIIFIDSSLSDLLYKDFI